MGDYLLGIDIGTTNCKALIFDTSGVQRAAASTPTPVHYPQPQRPAVSPLARAVWRRALAANCWQSPQSNLRRVQAPIDALWLQVAEAQQRGELTPQIAQQAQSRLAQAAQAAK